MTADGQLALLDSNGRAHRYGHGTERQAAASMREHTPRLREKVLGILRAHPAGLTDDEGGRLMGGDRLDFGRRRNELQRLGLVISTGTRRPTPHGRSAIVWRAV